MWGKTALSIAALMMLVPGYAGQSEWRSLFDGKTTHGWRGYLRPDAGGNWIVEDGALTCLGKGIDIITEEQFDNFELTLEWRISKGGNSGIFYHVVEDKKYKTPFETGPEYQLIDDVGFPEKLEPWQRAGADYAMYPASARKKLKPVGEWNTARIVFRRGHVEHWLNGVKIVEFEAWKEDWQKKKTSGKWKDYPDYGMARKGHIGLQDHESRVWFRNLKIKLL